MRITCEGKLLVGATSSSNNSIAEFTKEVAGGGAGCHITVENTSTNSVNNTAGIHLKTDQGTAKFFTFRATETYLQSRAGGNSDLILQANGTSTLKLMTNGVLRTQISQYGELEQKGTNNGYPSPTASININGGFLEIADDTSITMTSVANTGCIVDVGSDNRSGGSVTYANALFYVTYGSSTVVKLADPRDIFANSDTDDKVCVYKGSNTSGTFTIKNRMGVTNRISVSVIRFSGL